MRLIIISFLASLQLFGQFAEFLTSSSVYLELTSEQRTRIGKNSEDFNAWRITKQLRQYNVRAEIAEESQKEPADPIALGLRYAELEAINREIADREKALVTANQQLLNDAQHSRLRTLEEARRLQQVVSDAECQRLLGPAPLEGYFLTGIPTAIERGGACWYNFNSLPPFLEETASASLEDFLRLTPEQRTAYRANSYEYEGWSKTQMAILGGLRQTACTALAASPLNPGAIGAPYAAIAAIEQQIPRRHTALIQANQALLTADQKARLQILVEARALGSTISQAELGAFLEEGPPQIIRAAFPPTRLGAVIYNPTAAAGQCSIRFGVFDPA